MSTATISIKPRLKPKAAEGPPKGRVITFYSYKGGTGRSMALANVAWLLAMSGSRVLVIDWDLEAPGIHRYFHPFLQDKDLLNSEGLLDFVENLAAQSATATTDLKVDMVDVVNYIQPLEWPRDDESAGERSAPDSMALDWKRFPPRGRIDLMGAGRQGPAYARKLATFNWIEFYERLGGRRLLGMAREQLRGIYDYVLIDSRTGVSDTSGICTVEMPDTLVVCFTLNDQSIMGASAVAESVRAMRAKMGAAAGTKAAAEPVLDLPALRILPVPTRVEITSERDKRQVGLELARQTFSPFLDLPESAHGAYWGGIQMAYFPFYAFEEIPAVFGDNPNELLSLSTAIRQLTVAIGGDEAKQYPPLADSEDAAEKLRRRIVGWYLRRSANQSKDPLWLIQDAFDRLPATERDPTMACLARLVQIGDHDSLNPRTVLVSEFGGQFHLLQRFVDVRVISLVGPDTARAVSVVESALFEKWEDFRSWIWNNRQFLLVRQAVTGAMQTWKLAGESALLRGSILAQAQKWVLSRPADWNDVERQFIENSARADVPLIATPEKTSSAPDTSESEQRNPVPREEPYGLPLHIWEQLPPEIKRNLYQWRSARLFGRIWFMLSIAISCAAFYVLVNRSASEFAAQLVLPICGITFLLFLSSMLSAAYSRRYSVLSSGRDLWPDDKPSQDDSWERLDPVVKMRATRQTRLVGDLFLASPWAELALLVYMISTTAIGVWFYRAPDILLQLGSGKI
jgi:MinD-like ATPase involved in chromosome partitioning or flagellar assembly